MNTRLIPILTITSLLFGLTAHSGELRRTSEPVIKKVIKPEWVAYGPDYVTGSYALFPTDPVVPGEAATVALPDASELERLSVVALRENTNLTGKTLWAVMYMTIAKGGPAYFSYEYQKSYPADYVPACLRLFFSASAAPFEASGPSDEADYWCCNGNSGIWTFDQFEYDGQTPSSVRFQTPVTTDPSLWFDRFGHSAADPRYTAQFLDDAKNSQIAGLFCGGATDNVSDWWSGVSTSGPFEEEPVCTLHVQLFEPYTPRSKTGM